MSKAGKIININVKKKTSLEEKILRSINKDKQEDGVLRRAATLVLFFICAYLVLAAISLVLISLTN